MHDMKCEGTDNVLKTCHVQIYPSLACSVLISVRFVLSALTVCSGSLHLGVGSSLSTEVKCEIELAVTEFRLGFSDLFYYRTGERHIIFGCDLTCVLFPRRMPLLSFAANEEATDFVE